MRVMGPALFAHYLAAFTALGMPLFMPRILAVLAPESPAWLIGVLYVLPTVCTALTSAAWGRWADRHGRRLSLMRAQAGLAFGFLLAGFAPNLGWFMVALIIQGTFGGSLAAVNAYLSTQARPDTLSRALDWTQYSARLAMVTAPVLLGLATQTGLTRELYQYLAVLPCVALAITAMLPRDLPRAASMPGHTAAEAVSLSPGNGRHAAGLLVIQFLFCFAMVVTFPYFLMYSDHLGVSGDGMAGGLYSLPHLVYLVVMPWMRRWRPAGALLPWGLAVFSLACVGQAMLDDAAWLPTLRVVYGIGMLLSLMGLNRALAAQVCAATAGRLFGRFDACGKWAGALGGGAAGLLVANCGLATPFVAAAASAGLAMLVAVAFFVLQGSRRNDDVSTSYA